MKLLVIDAVGLRPKDLSHCPNIQAVAERGFAAPLEPVFPAVTCTAQASFLTGVPASGHGVVGNGWYFRDITQVMFWRQSNRLIGAETIYQKLLREDPEFRCSKMFWWFNMYAPVHTSVTPRPEYHADGLKKFGLYSEPENLWHELEEKCGTFPFPGFWGPKAGLPSTEWITSASLEVFRQTDPELGFVYLPHLDYDAQRFGPDDERSLERIPELDREAGRLIDFANERGAEVIVLSEYGIEKVDRPIYINRFLNERGYLRVQKTSHGELLDTGACRAFAVCDHQCAHVYVANDNDVAEVRTALAQLDGVGRILDRNEQSQLGIDHDNSGDLVLVSEPGTWFAYHYWLDEANRPDFAPTVDIHRKPGYDPTELFVDPKLSFPILRVVKTLLKKKLGFRYLMDVISTDASLVGGSHGRIDMAPEDGAVYVASSGAEAPSVSALEVRDRMLALLGGG
ncbi:MAG: nucleotide pyrophosphatase/phosphodiesterase family protein [Planctomycetota bacterium]